MARRLEDQSKDYEVQQLGYSVMRWPDLVELEPGDTEDVLSRAEREQDLEEKLRRKDEDDLAIDPLESDSRRGPGNVRPSYHGDMVEERRASHEARSPHVVTSVAPYLRETREGRLEQQFRMAGNWRVKEAHAAVLGDVDGLEHYRRDFLSRRPNPEMVRDVEENRDGLPEPEWYAELRRPIQDRYVDQRSEYVVEVDGRVMDGPFEVRSEADDVAESLGGHVVAEQVPLPEPVKILQLVDEAEPSIPASVSYVRADPALMTVALGREDPLPTEPGLDEDGVFEVVCRRLVKQHENLCRTHPAESRALEDSWARDRDKLREQVSDGSDGDLGRAMLDQMDEIVQHNTPIWDHMRYQAAVAHAVQPVDVDVPALPREVRDRLSDEAYPDLHAGVALVDSTSPLAVRPAGAGQQYDAAVLHLAESAVVGGCTWDWTLKDRGGRSQSPGADDDPQSPDAEAKQRMLNVLHGEPASGAARPYWGWEMRQDVTVSSASLLADVLALQERHERDGRLVPDLTSSLSPSEAQAGRAAAAAVDVLSALESRGVWVEFDTVDVPECQLDPDGTCVVLPETWRVQPEDFVPLDSDREVSDLDRLASGALQLDLADGEPTRDLYRAVGVASLRVLTSGETSFGGASALEQARAVAGPDAVHLDQRRLEHFAARCADASWARSPAVSGSQEPWRAPARLSSQSEVLDEMLDRAAGVDVRVLTRLAGRQADAHFRVRDCVQDSVQRLSEAVERLPEQGLHVDVEPGGVVSYKPDSRSLVQQRDPGAGPPADRVRVPEALLDSRQPAPQLIAGQRTFYEAVAAASGHPGRKERADAVTVARALSGRPVSEARLQAASTREELLVGGCARDRLVASYGPALVSAAGVTPSAPVHPAHAKRFAQARRWTRTATTPPPESAPVQERSVVPDRQRQPAVPGRGAPSRPPSLSASRASGPPPAQSLSKSVTSR